MFLHFLYVQRKENRKEKNRKKRKFLKVQYCKCTGLTKYANVSAYIPTFTDIVSPGTYTDLVSPF